MTAICTRPAAALAAFALALVTWSVTLSLPAQAQAHDLAVITVNDGSPPASVMM